MLLLRQVATALQSSDSLHKKIKSQNKSGKIKFCTVHRRAETSILLNKSETAFFLKTNGCDEIFLQFIEGDKTIEDDYNSYEDLLLKEDI